MYCMFAWQSQSLEYDWWKILKGSPARVSWPHSNLLWPTCWPAAFLAVLNDCEWRLFLQERGDGALGSNTLVYLWPGLQVDPPTALIQSKLKPPELKQDEDTGSPPACRPAMIPDPLPTVEAYDCHPVMILCMTFGSPLQPTHNHLHKCRNVTESVVKKRNVLSEVKNYATSVLWRTFGLCLCDCSSLFLKGWNLRKTLKLLQLLYWPKKGQLTVLEAKDANWSCSSKINNVNWIFLHCHEFIKPLLNARSEFWQSRKGVNVQRTAEHGSQSSAILIKSVYQ